MTQSKHEMNDGPRLAGKHADDLDDTPVRIGILFAILLVSLIGEYANVEVAS